MRAWSCWIRQAGLGVKAVDNCAGQNTGAAHDGPARYLTRDLLNQLALARISHQRFTESLSAEKAMAWRSLEKRKNRLLFDSA
jgi:hypothetical protein